MIKHDNTYYNEDKHWNTLYKQLVSQNNSRVDRHSATSLFQYFRLHVVCDIIEAHTINNNLQCVLISIVMLCEILKVIKSLLLTSNNNM